MGHRDDGKGIIAVIVIPIALVVCGLAEATRHIGPAAIPIWFAVCGAGAWSLRGPLGQALAQRIAGAGPAIDDEAQQGMYSEIDELRARVQELEERVDFSERMLVEKVPANSPT